MRPRRSAEQLRCALLKLSLQMLPFERKLAIRHRYRRNFTSLQDAPTVESIPSAVGLVSDRAQVRTDRPKRLILRPEALQLRMLRVPLRTASENRLRKQGLSPAGKKTLPIEQLGVQRPNSHSGISSAAAAIRDAMVVKITAWAGTSDSQ